MPPCRDFNSSNGCRYGKRCKYDHIQSRSDAPDNVVNTPLPRGVCRNYWKDGHCRWGFDCKYQHTQQQNTNTTNTKTSTASNSRSDTRASALELIAPFLKTEGLEKLSPGSGVDIFTSPSDAKKLSPQEMQNQLRRFLFDDYRFKTTAQMNSFALLFSHASTENSSWSDDDGQQLLVTISKGNGCLRINDILCFERVSISSGLDSNVLSFQRGYLPVLKYFCSDFVIKSTMNHLVNALYVLIDQNIDNFIRVIRTCLDEAMLAKSFKDSRRLMGPEMTGIEVFMPLVKILFEYLQRFKNATTLHIGISNYVDHLQQCVDDWIVGISSSPPSFSDPLSDKKEHLAFHTRALKECLQRSVDIVKREKRNLDSSASRSRDKKLVLKKTAESSELFGILAALENDYEGPGDKRENGPRHDNDFVNIENIAVAPTDDELKCRLAPFLPANIPNAPHPFPSDSMERLLDIQFRLLREELIASLRKACHLIQDDLKSSQTTKLHSILNKKGGRYQYQDKHESLMFNVYTGVQFNRFHCDRRRGLVVELRLDTPPGSARSEAAARRASYWKSGKRLMQGGLVALVRPRADGLGVYLGTVSNSLKDLEEEAKKSKDTICVRVTFYDASLNMSFLESGRRGSFQKRLLLIESPVMFEAIRPFLESLKREPESFPFRKYIVHHDPGTLEKITIDPPRYSLVPDYVFNLRSLLQEPDNIPDLEGPILKTTDEVSISTARNILKENSTLDPSQADAIVDALTREVSLLQGPPGTGKTYVGVELIRVLVKNKARPIVLIAFTNHALDHLLLSILDANITKRIVRLGSRSSDERISPFSIEAQERLSDRSGLDRLSKSEISEMKDIEKEIRELINDFVKTEISSEKLAAYLETSYPDHYEHLEVPPTWIAAVHALQGADLEDGWKKSSKKGNSDFDGDKSMYSFWVRGADLEFLQVSHSTTASRQQATSYEASNSNHFTLLSSENIDAGSASASSEHDSNSDDDDLSSLDFEDEWQNVDIPNEIQVEVEVQSSPPSSTTWSPSPIDSEEYRDSSLRLSDVKDAVGLFEVLGESKIPQVPKTDRTLPELVDSPDVWKMSKSERSRLHQFWAEEAREFFSESQKDRIRDLNEQHSMLRERAHERDTAIRTNIIRNCDIIACTTTGAAKLTSMLKGLAPKVMLVEEAGQVLEAHVLGSLVESVQHLILIGDPLQLRPTLNNYNLSMDNKYRGAKLFKFDRSLMERLSSSGLAMSRLNIQRRMRPSIADCIRTTLYPGLEDNELVKQYPAVRGMAEDVFFLSHSHPEQGGGEDSVSKHNIYEVEMIKDLVKYLLRQGCYSKEGGIVVLCAYLGQLSRVRDSLSQEFTVVLDERDQVALEDLENTVDDEEPHLERVKVTQRVKIRSIDNYQGEEADIVILSLVRNSGSGRSNKKSDSAFVRTGRSIGFLKSENRTNVALSRARHGLYILGNSSDLSAQSPMWKEVVEHLKDKKLLGNKLPIECHRHPGEIRYVSEPGELASLSPDGGCLRSCDTRLNCGHLCPYKCHCDDEQHLTTVCNQKCQRLCSRSHPCQKKCVDDCGNCDIPFRNVRLPCGHIKHDVPCWKMDDLGQVYCDEKVTRDLPSCEHKVFKECGMDVGIIKCAAICGGIMSCCGKNCKAKCSDCQEISPSPEENNTIRPRTVHKKHDCSKPLHCQHSCSGICSPDHKCIVQCKSTCRQKCIHSECRKPCSVACSPCKETCPWICPHRSCPVPCGSICTRLPCDKPCNNLLSCGHRCPSICGEDCSIQICLESTCTPDETLSMICDLILQRSLKDLMPDEGTLDELIITLPDCRHAFTVETLDGHCSMSDYYTQDEKGTWKGLKLPPLGYKKPPTCPTCRSAIRSPRYGRVYKRADLDILEWNVASTSERLLEQARALFSSFNKQSTLKSIKDTVHTISFAKVTIDDKEKKKQKIQREKLLKSSNDNQLPLEADSLNPTFKKLFGLPDSIGSVWGKMVQPLTDAYKQAMKVAGTRSAHTAAWESSFAMLYRNEIESYLTDLNSAPRNPEEHAMRMSKIRIGNSKPVADKKYCVEAIWLTIKIRFTLAEIASEWLEPNPLPPNYSSTYGLIWSVYIQFLLRSCERDAGLALETAERSENLRQISHSRLLLMNSWLEISKFNYQMHRKRGIKQDDRQKFEELVLKKRNKAEEFINKERMKYLELNQQDIMVSFTNTFLGPAQLLLQEFENLEQTIRSGVFYQPVTDEELKQTILALKSSEHSFEYSGHFYTCPNGHPFSIGDCGGANGTSRCPECFEQIGGHGHALLSTNRRDTRMENLARELGTRQSPWEWNRDA